MRWLVFVCFVSSLAIACKSGGEDASPPGGATGTGASSSDKIDAAVAAGKLDPDTAILYHLYALYGPELLPAEYLGDDTHASQEGTWYFSEAAGRLGAMTPELRAKIEPFLRRPTDKTSFWAGRTNTSSTALHVKGTATDVYTGHVDVGSKVRIWYTATDQARAQTLADGLTAHDAWGKYQTIMGLEPPSDSGPGDYGDSDAIDFYLVRGLNARAHDTVSGSTMAATSPTAVNIMKRNASSFVLVDARLDGNVLTGTGYHELFHCFQNAFPGIYPERSWFDEATAEFMIDWVDPNNDTEHASLTAAKSLFLRNPGGPLDHAVADSGYGAYIFPFYVSRVAGADPRWIGETYAAMTADATATFALKKPLDVLGARKEWKDWIKGFTVANLNLPPQPYVDHGEHFPFKQPMDDTLVDLAKSPYSMKTKGFGHTNDTFDHLVFSASKTFIAKATFDFSSLPANVAVQAIKKMTGKDTFEPVEDWTGTKTYTFCRDQKAESLDEIYILLTNTGTTAADDKDIDYTVTATDKPCIPEEGTLTYDGKVIFTGASDPAVMKTATGTITHTAHLDTKWKLKQKAPDPATDGGAVIFEMTGTNAWSVGASGSITVSTGTPVIETTQYTETGSGTATSHNPTIPGDDAYEIAKVYGTLGTDWQAGELSIWPADGTYQIALSLPGIAPKYTWHYLRKMPCASDPGSDETTDETYDNTTRVTHSVTTYCPIDKTAPYVTDNTSDTPLVSFLHGHVTDVVFSGTYNEADGFILAEQTLNDTSCDDAIPGAKFEASTAPTTCAGTATIKIKIIIPPHAAPAP